MKITKLFPGGNRKALTFSYDDGVAQDVHLVEIFNKYGLKSTFNLNSGIQSEESCWVNGDVTIRRLNKEEILKLYKGHEVAVHGLSHPFLQELPRELIINEIFEDRKNLESWFGYPVRGMAYPYGTYNKIVLEVMRTLGIEYSRTVVQHESFILPENPLEWHSTCHHNNPKLSQLAEKFVQEEFSTLSLFYVWGHSYEFDVDRNWDRFEGFCEYVSRRKDIWYASNIEILDYLKALENLKFSADTSMVYNPSAVSAWLEAGGCTVEIKPGCVQNLCSA